MYRKSLFRRENELKSLVSDTMELKTNLSRRRSFCLSFHRKHNLVLSATEWFLFTVGILCSQVHLEAIKCQPVNLVKLRGMKLIESLSVRGNTLLNCSEINTTEPYHGSQQALGIGLVHHMALIFMGVLFRMSDLTQGWNKFTKLNFFACQQKCD